MRTLLLFILTTSRAQNADTVTFSHKGGFYQQDFSLSLSTKSVAQIFYTMDGSVPTASSLLYVSSISITQPTVIRAIAIAPEGLPGKIVTKTYIVNRSHTLPVVSITTDPENLWNDTTGIYVNGPNASPDYPYFGANFWEDWERPVHIELFEKNGELAFSEDAGVKILGGWSRAYAQKSLAIHFRKIYGVGKVNYPIFPNLELDKYSALVLRSSGNDWNRTMFRDAFCTSLFHPSIDKQAYRPAVLYINGQYWGIQNMREKVNEDFLASHHNYKDDDINLLGTTDPSVIAGSGDHYYNLLVFTESHDLSIPSNFDYVESQMDVMNFIHYCVGNILIDNQDWPGSNSKWWRANGDTTRWRWIAYDTDFSSGIYDSTHYSHNSINDVLDPNGPEWPNPYWSTVLIRNLMRNPGFQRDFINTMADQLNTNFQPSFMNVRIDQMVDEIKSEIASHYTRWESTNDWNVEVENLRRFSNYRGESVKSHILSTFNLSGVQKMTLTTSPIDRGSIEINTLRLDQFPWKGEYFKGNEVTLRAIPELGYRFIRWEGDVESTSIKISLDPESVSNIKAVFGRVDASNTTLVINEINYNSDNNFPSEDWVELINVSSEDVNLNGWFVTDEDPAHKFYLPNQTISPDDYLVICRDKEKFEMLYSNIFNVFGNTDFGWSSSGDCVRLYDPEGVITDEVCYTNKSPWPTEPDGKGYTLGLLSPRLNNGLAKNWYAESDHGSPGLQNIGPLVTSEVPESIVFIYPNPTKDYLTIEVKENSEGPASIAIYSLEGTKIFTLVDHRILSKYTEVEWQLPPGILPGHYFLEYKTGQKTQAFRFIVD